jgi:ATP-dependent helicase/nuclease subunit A
VYVGVPVEGADGDVHVVEGYIDLLYRDDGGLVVADYKTSASGSDDVLDARMERYRAQGAAYALAVADSTGEPVTRCTFVFLTPDGAIERDLPDLAAAVDEIRVRAAGTLARA